MSFNEQTRWFLLRLALGLLAIASTMGGLGCNSTKPAAVLQPVSPQQTAPKISVVPNDSGALVISSPVASFEILPSGYVRGSLLQDGRQLTLDDPGMNGATNPDYAVIDGKEVRDFAMDWTHAQVKEPSQRLGATGKRIVAVGRSPSRPDLEKTIAIELYDNFPTLLLSTATYKNAGTHPVKLDRVIAQEHHLNASQADPAVPKYQMWSFHGSSEKWGKDDVVLLSKSFMRGNPMQQVMSGDPGTGGGIPVVAFWTAAVGEAIGHIETLPTLLSIPVRVEKDGLVNASVQLSPSSALQPGEVYSTPVTFLAVYRGDYYEPLSLYSKALGAQGWKLPTPTDADYEANWCGWGYELKFTPAQMIGTIPKLKELGIKWATLDAGWFNDRGDWEPRPGMSAEDMKKVVDAFHNEGIRITLWWIPIVAEDGQRKDVLDQTPYHLADVVKQHPDWLILDRDGNHARMTAGLAGLCPAVPEVQQYYKKLTDKFIREWGFDGHKLDFSYTVPACYNLKHHHKSPEESTRAMGDVYSVVFQTTRALKPDSVTQSCPCGTPPNMAWLPFIDQAVTADPVGSVQVRRRIKMYKALLGPASAVYGDHVELTRIAGANTRDEKDIGRDFASTVGAGGVVGTKFTWPDYGPKLRNVYLTQEKEAYWKKWIEIYNQKMLSRGTFRNLYIYGYEVPEAYAIEKDGKMYYAFFATPSWKGTLQLRGLAAGSYRVLDYESGRDLGSIDGARAELAIQFRDHLLLEVSKQ